MSDYCPACGTDLVIKVPLHCTNCHWRLITRAEWKALKPFRQGYMLYAQGALPMSELAACANPYARGTTNWMEFRDGAHRAMINAQDGGE